MTNRLRTEIQEEEIEEVVETKAAPKKDSPENFLITFFKKGTITTEMVTKALPFMLFVVFLGMVYIGNMHMAETNIRQIEKLDKEVKELTWDYKNAKAQMAFKNTLSEVTRRADTLGLGLKEPIVPPQKITVKEDKQ